MYIPMSRVLSPVRLECLRDARGQPTFKLPKMGTEERGRFAVLSVKGDGAVRRRRRVGSPFANTLPRVLKSLLFSEPVVVHDSDADTVPLQPRVDVIGINAIAA